MIIDVPGAATAVPLNAKKRVRQKRHQQPGRKTMEAYADIAPINPELYYKFVNLLLLPN
jgi:hypothetical protein